MQRVTTHRAERGEDRETDEHLSVKMGAQSIYKLRVYSYKWQFSRPSRHSRPR